MSSELRPEAELRGGIEPALGQHPFIAGVTPANSEAVLGHYLAMSIAFPYIQAAAIGDTFKQVLDEQGDVDAEAEATAVVGAFLVWDEFGGHGRLMAGGMPALPEILRTDAFHANLLRRDLRTLFGHEVKPCFAEPTKSYLAALRAGMGNPDPLRRVACMASVEQHAGPMITALWDSLVRDTGCDRDSLEYFSTHVGGDDPGEAHHVEMTQRLLASTVSAGDGPSFAKLFDEAYALHWNWCADLASLPVQRIA